MPLFMAISGAVFSFGIQKFKTLGGLVRNKAKRLLLPFLLVTTFIAVPLKYFAGYYIGSTHVLRDIFLGQYLLLGNSHLWFVVSLFYIFVIFYVLERYHLRKGFIYWSLLFGLSWFIWLLSHFDIGINAAGLYTALNHLLYFALGFSTFNYWNDVKTLSVGKQILSWFGFIAAVTICGIIPKYTESIVIKVFLYLPMNTLLALWGCTNMVFLAKSVNQCAIIKSTYTYRFMNKYNYELYLYSDPFNYVLIALLFAWFGQNLFTSNVHSFLAYMLRFFGTILWAALVIGIVHMVKNRKLLSPSKI